MLIRFGNSGVAGNAKNITEESGWEEIDCIGDVRIMRHLFASNEQLVYLYKGKAMEKDKLLAVVDTDTMLDLLCMPEFYYGNYEVIE